MFKGICRLLGVSRRAELWISDLGSEWSLGSNRTRLIFLQAKTKTSILMGQDGKYDIILYNFL